MATMWLKKASLLLSILSALGGAAWGGCDHGQWECLSGDCVLREVVCDGRSSCGDGSDEGAVCRNGTCPYFLFTCGGGGQCVSNTVVCNGVEDCEDGRDESVSMCGVKKEIPPPPPHYNTNNTQESRGAGRPKSSLTTFLFIILTIDINFIGY